MFCEGQATTIIRAACRLWFKWGSYQLWSIASPAFPFAGNKMGVPRLRGFRKPPALERPYVKRSIIFGPANR
jgi:hypothetical protein